MKIRCINPNHEDSTPSMHCYEETAHCFVCNFTVPIEEVLNSEEIKKINKAPKEKEDIQKTIQFILGLPKKEIRGLQLHYDGPDYFILWPDNSFYKRRIRDSVSRYLGPRGHQPPLFKLEAEDGSKQILVIVEGEANVLSLDLCIGHGSVSLVSPGSANNFCTFISFYCTFETIIIIVDYDEPGVKNGIRLKEQLQQAGKRVRLITLRRDFNDTLQLGGVEAVRQQLIDELG